MLVGKKELSGVEYEVHATFNEHSGGRWEIRLEGGSSIGQGETFEKAVQSARSTLHRNKVKVSVPFISQRSLERGTATGVHHKTSNLMVRWESTGKSEQVSEYHLRALRPSTPKDAVDRIGKIRELKKELEAEERTLLKEYELPLRDVVETAIKAASGV